MKVLLGCGKFVCTTRAVRSAARSFSARRHSLWRVKVTMCVKHVANSCIAARPDGLTPTAGRPKTISQLKVDVMQAQLDMETPAAEEKDKEEDGIVDTEPDGSKAGKKRAAGIGLVAAPKKVSKGKGGGKGSKVPNPRSPVRSVSSTQPSQASPAVTACQSLGVFDRREGRDPLPVHGWQCQRH